MKTAVFLNAFPIADLKFGGDFCSGMPCGRLILFQQGAFQNDFRLPDAVLAGFAECRLADYRQRVSAFFRIMEQFRGGDQDICHPFGDADLVPPPVSALEPVSAPVVDCPPDRPADGFVVKHRLSRFRPGLCQMECPPDMRGGCPKTVVPVAVINILPAAVRLLRGGILLQELCGPQRYGLLFLVEFVEDCGGILSDCRADRKTEYCNNGKFHKSSPVVYEFFPLL